MLNMTLYKRGMQENYKMILIFVAVLTMYFLVVIPMFDPALGSALDEFFKAMPELMKMFGMNPASTSLTSFMASYLYGLIMLIFPMIFSIICANRLVARHVDKGSMVYLLAAPVKRTTIAFTQIKVLCSGIFILVIYATVLGIVACEGSFPGKLDIPGFIMLNVGVLALQLLIAGICFLSSCIFNDTRQSVAFGAGIPGLAFVIQLLANTGDSLSKAKYFTFFTLFNTDGIISGDSVAVIQILILFIAAIIVFAAALTVFVKKDMHI